MGEDNGTGPSAKGFPIYRDPAMRGVVDPAAEFERHADWRPVNTAAATLWRCIEALRDVREVLEAASSSEDLEKRRRRLKGIAVPLLSLANDASRLCGHFSTAPWWKDRLTTEQRKIIAGLREGLEREVPLEQNSALREIRDRYAAHIDKKLLPHDARSILNRVTSKDFGRWLHACIATILELLELNVYSWRADDIPSGHVRAMNVEPWVITWKNDEGGKPVMVGLDIGDSPRQAAADLCRDVVAASQWLFGKGDARLVVVDEQVGPVPHNPADRAVG
jgi:hypothetical protein